MRQSKMSAFDISIIIVNWNSAEYVKACLHSVYRETKNVKFEVIVVDNASYDRCGEMLKYEFPQVKFIQNTENSGFATANNVGFQRSVGRFVLFLNPDTVVLESAINIMQHHMQNLKDAGAIGCRLLNTDGSLQTSSILPFPTILNQSLNYEPLRLLFPRMVLWGIRPLFEDTGAHFVVQAVSGACIMVRREVFEKVGMFSTDYFMYSEDIDLCHKISMAGYKVYFVRTATIVHHGGGSSNQRKESSYADIQMRESVFKFLRRTRGGLYASGYRLTMCVVALIRIGIISILYMPTMCLGRFSSRRYSLMKWIGILRWSLALEKWSK